MKTDIVEKIKVKEDLNKYKNRILNNRSEIIQEKLNSLIEVIKKLPDRKPSNPKNQTIKEYLLNEKKLLEDNPNDFIDNELNKVNKAIEELNKLKSITNGS